MYPHFKGVVVKGMGLFLARNGKLGLCSTLDKVGCSLMCIGLDRYYSLCCLYYNLEG